MCKYCSNDKKALYEEDYDVLIDIINNNIRTVFEGYKEYNIKINYCPMCGRKLS